MSDGVSAINRFPTRYQTSRDSKDTQRTEAKVGHVSAGVSETTDAPRRWFNKATASPRERDSF
jgi:hypothetical protein